MARQAGPERRDVGGPSLRIETPTGKAIAEAAEAIRAGKLVGMPTETVYGIAANALDPDAVRATFEAKGRPADNPLIVHLADFSQMASVAQVVSHAVSVLAERFWPGPLTMVVPRSDVVPSVTTGGLDSVAVRVPAHPVARQLIELSGVPLSAPSANLFMALSPTRAEDISAEIAERLALILDGGPCEVGLESTVLDCTVDPPVVLRPGHVSAGEISSVLGVSVAVGTPADRRSPGLYPKHYAPRAKVVLVDRLAPGQVVITFGDARAPTQIRMPQDPVGFGASLYAVLHAMDTLGATEIAIGSPPDASEWAAVWDRLRRMTD